MRVEHKTVTLHVKQLEVCIDCQVQDPAILYDYWKYNSRDCS